MTIQLNRDGYDPFIDFIKAFAIICVLMGHTFPYLNTWGYAIWAGMQVPLFLLVQTFHSYKANKDSINIKKLFNRILLPFIIAEIIIFICLTIKNGITHGLIIKYLMGGGRAWIILPLGISTICYFTSISKTILQQIFYKNYYDCISFNLNLCRNNMCSN